MAPKKTKKVARKTASKAASKEPKSPVVHKLVENAPLYIPEPQYLPVRSRGETDTSERSETCEACLEENLLASCASITSMAPTRRLRGDAAPGTCLLLA